MAPAHASEEVQALPSSPSKTKGEASRPVIDIEDLGKSMEASWDGSEALLRRQLLAWYAGSRRRLPWRGDPPPWCVEKAALRQAAAAEAAAKTQPRISSFFQKKLRPSEAANPPREIDLEEDGSPQEAPASGAGAGEAAGAFARSAYGTWVSEVMLQQTQVERVVEYWTRWMKLFPSVHALAEAEGDEVNAAWAGLGFYGRARRLHEGAKYVVRELGGELPGDVEALKRVPGVGPYTAGAVASIAFGRRASVVDGNVIRVFSRLRALPGDASSPALSRKCWELADELVDHDEPGAFNQSLMELGATVCTPQAPACDRCPVRGSCRAAALAAAGRVSAVTEFPAKAPKKAPKLRSFAVAALLDAAGRALLVRRPPTGLLAGQWEFPSAELESSDEDAATQLSKLQQLLRSELAAVLPKEPPALTAVKAEPVEHVFSHERHTMHLYHGSVGQDMGGIEPSGGTSTSESAQREARWMTPAEASAAGITSGVHKVFAALGLPAVGRGEALRTPSPPAKRPRQRRSA